MAKKGWRSANLSPDRRIFFGQGRGDVRSRALAARVTASFGSRGGASTADLLFPLLFPPTLISVTPNTGFIVGGTVVDLAGLNFRSGATVTFNGTPATVVSITPTHIIVNTPAHASGVVDVTVTNPDLQFSTLVGGFTYLEILLAAVNASGGSIYSSDGLTWSAGAGLPLGITAITWAEELGVFIAMGAAGFGATSPDGHVWASFVIPVRSLTTLAWSGSLAVAAPNGGEAGLSSVDGTTWVDHTINDGFFGAFSVLRWSDTFGLFDAAAGGTNFIAFSATGASGTWANNFPFVSNFFGIAYSAITGIMVGNAGANRGAISSNGTVWAQIPPATLPALNYADIAYGNGRFVAVVTDGGGGGAQVSLSEGVTWSPGVLPAGAWKSCVFNDDLGLFIAVGAAGGGSKIATSIDGFTWALSAASATFAMSALATN
jgi:hypothetical protein